MAEKRLVWDLPLRIFHWVFALSLLGSYLTARGGFEYMQYHFWLGYWIIGLVLFRLIWGFVGPKYSRFSHFVPGPSRLLSYIRTLPKRESLPTIGHNAGGGLVVVLMLLMVLLQAVSGLFTTDDIAFAGPYNPAVSGATAGTFGWIHHLNFSVLQWVVLTHVAAILFYWLYKRQNLTGAMLHGHKPATLVAEHEAIQGSELLKALVVALICAAAIYALLHFAPPEPEISY